MARLDAVNAAVASIKSAADAAAVAQAAAFVRLETLIGAGGGALDPTDAELAAVAADLAAATAKVEALKSAADAEKP